MGLGDRTAESSGESANRFCRGEDGIVIDVSGTGRALDELALGIWSRKKVIKKRKTRQTLVQLTSREALR